MTTDTAIPMPDEPDPGALTPVQRQRAAALDVARAALVTRGGLFAGSDVKQWSVGDLTYVAEWVLGRTVDDDEPGVSEPGEPDFEWNPATPDGLPVAGTGLSGVGSHPLDPGYPEDALPR